MTDPEKIKLLTEKDEKAMADFVADYTPLVRYVISPILNNELDKEDCISEVFLKVWNNVGSYDPGKGSISGWVTAIARNTAINKAKRNKPLTSLDELTFDLPSNEPTPEEIVIIKERQRLLSSAIGKLSQKEQVLFYRKYYYMQSTAQIASELGTTERAVEGKLYRIKKRLRKILGGDFYE